MSLSELLGNVGPFGAAVMLCLAALSIYSIAMIVDKQVFMRELAYYEIRSNSK